MTTAREFNFDGLVGPSHNYGGLSFGNVASQRNEGQPSNPRQAALQGLAKMRALHELGIPQAVFPPHLRPDLSLARRLGFGGDDAAVLQGLYDCAPQLLAACWSASSMWTANAATVCPSADSGDGRVHFTPANLLDKLHRSIEAPTTGRILRAVFPDPQRFAVHAPLPATSSMGDEGAANHTRLAAGYGGPGVQLFVYGESAASPMGPKPKKFPARQTLEACEAQVRLAGLSADRVVLAQQHPDVIDAGVFHNDVIAVGNLDTLLFHEEAFLDSARVLGELQEKFLRATSRPLQLLQITSAEVPVEDAVKSYLFNSQLVRTQGGRTVLIAPREAQENDRVRACIERLVAGPAPIDEVRFLDLRQSMQGGGGPACLRLRVVLTAQEEAALAPGVRFSPALHESLVAWVERHYRSELRLSDLRDPGFARECRDALEALCGVLGLGGLYGGV
jgi:succinylarginine dihydrolase